MSVRFDMASGKFYVNMAGSVLADAGLDKDTWYLMDMNALYAQAGMKGMAAPRKVTLPSRSTAISQMPSLYFLL